MSQESLCLSGATCLHPRVRHRGAGALWASRPVSWPLSSAPPSLSMKEDTLPLWLAPPDRKLAASLLSSCMLCAPAQAHPRSTAHEHNRHRQSIGCGHGAATHKVGPCACFVLMPWTALMAWTVMMLCWHHWHLIAPKGHVHSTCSCLRHEACPSACTQRYRAAQQADRSGASTHRLSGEGIAGELGAGPGL